MKRLQLACLGGIMALATPALAQVPAIDSSNLPSDSKGIYYGQEATKGAYPFIVAVIDAEAGPGEEDLYMGQYCAGSLISNRWVVTAANCVTREGDDGQPRVLRPAEIDIYAGSNEFKGGRRIKVSRIIRHPDFKPAKFDSDIALLQLASDVPTAGTGTVSLVTPANAASIAAVGKKVSTAGWGETETGDFPKALRFIDIDILDSNSCNAAIIKFRADTVLTNLQAALELDEALVKQIRELLETRAGKAVTDNMLCSGRLQTQRDTCGGDNGGPLFTKTSDGKFVQVGITSWGEGCGRTDQSLFGIYTRVSKFSTWVQQNAR